ncbi:MAG: hypothetical protein LBJ11_04325 [Oscillospiraceae bacterium]|jgi:ABC-type glycerol-3-phosphate transport system permease component|nr:hypothetical protein [Oscillospiraceae bacterium]
MTGKQYLIFIKDRRWDFIFLSLVAGVFAAPFLYWNGLLMRIALRASHTADLLLGMNYLYAVGNLLFLLLGALGLGACLSALRRLLNGTSGFLPKDILRGLFSCAPTSLLCGAVLGLSLNVFQLGWLYLVCNITPGPLRCGLAALLLAQMLFLLPMALLGFTQPDETQRHPLRVLAEAAGQLAARPLRALGLAVGSILPLTVPFWNQYPAPTMLTLAFLALCGLALEMLLWQSCSSRWGTGAGRGITKRAACWLMLGFLLLAGGLGIGLPLATQAAGPYRAVQTNLRETFGFLWELAMLDADNGTLRELMASMYSWPLTMAAMLGAVCVVVTAFAAACVDFPCRRLLLAGVLAVQVIPIKGSFAGLDQLLLKLQLPLSAFWAELIWSAAYLLLALGLYLRFVRLLPRMAKAREATAGMHLFFYHGLSQVRGHALLLVLLASLGGWNDILTPFLYLRRLDSLSVFSFVWTEFAWSREVGPFFVLLAAALAAVVLLLKGIPKMIENKFKTTSRRHL